MNNRKLIKSRGFTIVELLIVVVVIAVLAAVVVVAYAGITSRAAEAAIQTDLQAAATRLSMDNEINGTYPANLTEANDGQGVPAPSGASYGYTYRSSTNDYCLSATSDNVAIGSYNISSTTGSVQAGDCASFIALGSVGEDLDLDGVVDSTQSDLVSTNYYYSGGTFFIGGNLVFKGPIVDFGDGYEAPVLSEGQKQRWGFYDDLTSWIDTENDARFWSTDQPNTQITSIRFYAGGAFVGSPEGTDLERCQIAIDEVYSTGALLYFRFDFPLPGPIENEWTNEQLNAFLENGRIEFTAAGGTYAVYVIGEPPVSGGGGGGVF